MSGLEIALAGAALAIGLTGTWSPCGFSMVETIGPVGHTGGRRTTLAACATFLPGALVGALATFWTLAALGGAIHSGGPVAFAIAAAIAIGAAVLEARGTPIVPQIRRQLPEHWRRTMPMPLASALYGGLLGLGFTTFVLTFGVWALAAISFAVGNPGTGLVVGIAFGLGRALPIVGLAPLAGSAGGARVTETMAMRPDIYRAFRAGDAVALTAVAALLAGTAAAGAATTEAKPGADPSVAAERLAFQNHKRQGVLLEGGTRTDLPGKHPAISSGYVAVRSGNLIRLLDPATLAELDTIAAGKPGSISLSEDWIAWLRSRRGRDRIEAAPISAAGEFGDGRLVQRTGRGPHLSPPSVDGSRVAYALSSERRSQIFVEQLGGRGTNRVLRTEEYALTTPSLRNDDLAYVRIGKRRQQLMITGAGGGGFGRSIESRSRKSGVLWTTALGPNRVYATLVKGGHSQVISAGR